MKTKKEKAKFYANLRKSNNQVKKIFSNEQSLERQNSFGFKDLTPYNAIQSIKDDKNIILI